MSNQPKRPPPPRGPPPPRDTREDIELPFDTSDVTPLRADDPRPQRVTQYPAQRRARAEQDTELIELPEGALDGALPEPEYRPVFLYVERGPGAGQLVPVRQGKIQLGRSSTADLRLQHSSVSRRHAELRREGERFFIGDLGSQNGTYVNKTQVRAEHELSIGDAISLGTAVLRLRGPIGAGEPEPTAPRRSRALTFAVFGCAVGFGLAGILLYALLRTQSEPPAPAQVALPLNAPKPLPGPIAQAPVPAPVTLPAYQSAPVETAPVKRAPIDPPVPMPEPKGAPEHHATPKHAIAKPAHLAHHESQPKPAAEPEPRFVSTNDPLGAYRAGQLTQALQLARSNPELAAQLSRFDSVYTQARKALAAHDLETAKRRLTTALALDEEIAQGSGKLNATIRADLAKIGAIDGSSEPAPAPEPRPAAKTTKSQAKSAIDAAFGE
jgi:hypothetical protein